MSSPNERLRSEMLAYQLTPAMLASRVGTDPKTVERWLTQGRVPHPSTRRQVAEILGRDERYLWSQVGRGDAPELVQIWPTREQCPAPVWQALMSQASRELNVLVYSGGFLVEVLGLLGVIRVKAPAGVRIRILLGDPASPVVAQRGVDEGLPSLPARCASTAEYLRSVRDLDNVEVRTHETPLYVSLYGFDDDWLVNPHTHGLPAMDNPVLHLQKVPGGRLVPHYEAAFERVWATGRPLA